MTYRTEKIEQNKEQGDPMPDNHPILNRVRGLGFRVFTDGDFNLNLVGIRSRGAKPNSFDDTLHVIYKDGGQWVDRWWAITTDPGQYWLKNPMNRLGAAAVVADRQYPGLWKVGQHRGEYTALVQANDVAVHRDANKDGKVDYRADNIQTGRFGINLHRAGSASASVQVDRWSAGCQVFASPDDFAAFLRIAEKQVSVRGWDSFTYTLLNEW